LEPSAELGALETVAIHGSKHLRNLEPLAKLDASLKSVLLNRCRVLRDVSDLMSLKWECAVQVTDCELATDSFIALKIARQRRQRAFLARKIEGDVRVV
jgi:hypothetical protein